MGKALYREHRPLKLDDVKGQSHITDTLKQALKKGAISHAYLFTGPRGVGKTSIARILAHEINNLPYSDEETHLDIIEIDAASNRRIDEIRDLRDKVHIAPTSAKYKVYIIDEVHMLTREAFNALLKTLEEPPEHAVFILATTEAHKVPDTIISRTQQFSFRPVSDEEAAKHLRKIADQEKMSIEDDALLLLARHGNGSFRDSISMLDQLSGFDIGKITAKEVALLLGVPNQKALEIMLECILQSDVSGLFTSIQTAGESGSNPSKIAQALITLMRDKLSSSSSSLPYDWSVSFMKDLLPLTAGTATTFEALEITLLGAITIPEKTRATKKIVRPASSETKVPPKESTPAVAIAQKKDVNKNTSKTKILTQSATDITLSIKQTAPALTKKNSEWDEVLHILKTHHNTLYGVLRMAEVFADDSSLTLQFQFDFHKKQLAQSKKMKALQQVITDVYGAPKEIKTVVKEQEKIAKSPAVAVVDTTLSSVSNIFNGAELLES